MIIEALIVAVAILAQPLLPMLVAKWTWRLPLPPEPDDGEQERHIKLQEAMTKAMEKLGGGGEPWSP